MWINKNYHIFDLIKTKKLAEEALEFLYNSTKEGKTILFVGTKKQIKDKNKKQWAKTY